MRWLMLLTWHLASIVKYCLVPGLTETCILQHTCASDNISPNLPASFSAKVLCISSADVHDMLVVLPAAWPSLLLGLSGKPLGSGNLGGQLIRKKASPATHRHHQHWHWHRNWPSGLVCSRSTACAIWKHLIVIQHQSAPTFLV